MDAHVKITKKLNYYQGQKSKAQERYMETSLKRDRDSAIRCTERVKAYYEVLEILKETA